MTDAEILTKVKNALGITGDFQDDTLQVYIADVKGFMLDAGVDSAVVNSAAAVGCISRGVADLWNYGSGNAKLSSYFVQRVQQLRAQANSSGDGSTSSGDNFRVTITMTDAQSGTADHTPAEIAAAFESGKNVYAAVANAFGQNITVKADYNFTINDGSDIFSNFNAANAGESKTVSNFYFIVYENGLVESGRVVVNGN